MVATIIMLDLRGIIMVCLSVPNYLIRDRGNIIKSKYFLVWLTRRV